MNGIAITDEASPFALRSTRIRLRKAVRRGAAQSSFRARQGSGQTVQLWPSANLRQVVGGSGCGLEAGVDVGGDQLDLLAGEGLPGRLQGGAEGARGKDGNAVDQELAMPGEAGDMNA
jgi:hypothetical protein